MVILRALLIATAFMSLACQRAGKADVGSGSQTSQTSDAGLRQREREFAAILSFEILWNKTPAEFRLPQNGRARLASYQTSEAFWYCSHDLGVCRQYRLVDNRFRHLGKSFPCDDDLDDKSSVLKFVEQYPKPYFTEEAGKETGTGSSPKPYFTEEVGKETGISSSPKPAGTLWTWTVELSNREEIVKQYKQMRPAELAGLRDWLRTYLRKNAGYRSVTIACFAPTDPVVFIYGDRPMERRGPIVFSVFWDRERGWVEAGLLESDGSPKKFEELKSMIQSIACETIKFN